MTPHLKSDARDGVQRVKKLEGCSVKPEGVSYGYGCKFMALLYESRVHPRQRRIFTDEGLVNGPAGNVR